MTRSKLSDQEKQEVVSLFEEQQETISSLALRYEVSASTIRRLLKQPTAEKPPVEEPPIEKPPIEEIILPPKTPKPISKRFQANVINPTEPVNQTVETDPIFTRRVPAALGPVDSKYKISSPETPKRQIPLRRRDRLDAQETESIHTTLESEHPLAPSVAESNLEDRLHLTPNLVTPQDDISEILREISHELDGTFAPPSLGDEDEESEEDEDFEDLDDDLDFASSGEMLQLQPEVLLEVMPLSDAVFPKTCYLVIDRTAELVTRPLKDFGELGQIPVHEIQARTLPVFDNHRIARRFSHRTQRIIKVPNGEMIKATSAQLSAKGITRLLVNGRIYAL
jgi:transposase-like protein